MERCTHVTLVPFVCRRPWRKSLQTADHLDAENRLTSVGPLTCALWDPEEHAKLQYSDPCQVMEEPAVVAAAVSPENATTRYSVSVQKKPSPFTS